MGQRLGQHYLFDRSILERIAGAACGEHASTVIEIGPGPGGLTERLLLRCDRLVAVELDHALAEALRSRYAADARFELVEADVLHIDLSHWGRAVVVGNIPYYITSPIVERALGLGPLLERAVFLVQKEVAARLAAAPGSRDYGYLSVAVQLRCHVQTLFSVKRGAFRPPPQSRKRGRAARAPQRAAVRRRARLPAIRFGVLPAEAQDAEKQPGRSL